MNTKLSKNQISEIVNVAAKAGYDITAGDVKRVLNAQQSLWQEPCDCYDRHGQIRHNNGGNYHATLELYVGSGYAVVYSSDTSETFPMDGSLYITARDNGEWDEYYAQYECEYDNAPTDYIVVLNRRRDQVLGLVKL